MTRKVNGLGVLFIALAKVKLQLVFAIDAQDSRKGPSHLADKPLQGTNLSFGQQSLNLSRLKRATARVFANREITLGTGIATIVFFDHATTLRAR